MQLQQDRQVEMESGQFGTSLKQSVKQVSRASLVCSRDYTVSYIRASMHSASQLFTEDVSSGEFQYFVID